MTPSSGLDGLDELLNEPLEVRDGCAILPARPGLGIAWDWEAVSRSAGG